MSDVAARIIVVDDDANIRALLRVMLEDAGYDVVGAGDGDAALRVIRDLGADLVLTDLFMPTMDGLELIRALRRERPSLKVIAMSGGGFGGTVDVLAAARRLGAADIIRKPFTADDIPDAVGRAIGEPAHRMTIWVRDERPWYLPGDRVRWERDPEDRLIADQDGPYEIEHTERDPTRSPGLWLKVRIRQIR